MNILIKNMEPAELWSIFSKAGVRLNKNDEKIRIECFHHDVAEIVHCKECIHWRPDNRPEGSLEDRTDGLWGDGDLCAMHLPNDELEAIEFGPDEWCNFGERK